MSFPAGGAPADPQDTMTIAIVQDSQNQFYLQIVIGSLSVQSSNPTTCDIAYSSPAFKDTSIISSSLVLLYRLFVENSRHS